MICPLCFPERPQLNSNAMTSRNLKNFEFRLGRQGILLFAVGMSLLLFFVFIFGVMVGLHIDAYPEKIARGIPQIIRKQLEHSPEKTDRMPQERAEAGSRPSGEEGNPPPALIGSLPPQPSQTTADAVAVNKNPLAVTGEGGAKPSAVVDSESEPENGLLPKYSTGTSRGQNQADEGKYMLRVASFNNRKKAEQFCKKLTSLGYSPHIAVVELPKKGRWFRVVIEGFKTEEEARKEAAVLSEKIKGVNCVIRPMQLLRSQKPEVRGRNE